MSNVDDYGQPIIEAQTSADVMLTEPSVLVPVAHLSDVISLLERGVERASVNSSQAHGLLNEVLDKLKEICHANQRHVQADHAHGDEQV